MHQNKLLVCKRSFTHFACLLNCNGTSKTHVSSLRWMSVLSRSSDTNLKKHLCIPWKGSLSNELIMQMFHKSPLSKTLKNEGTTVQKREENENPFEELEDDPDSNSNSNDDGQSNKKKAFLSVLKTYKSVKMKRDVCDFIIKALEVMPEYGLHKDLDTYKKLIDLFPKGRFVGRSILHSELLYFSPESVAILRLLEEMTKHGVEPDEEMGLQILSIFGLYSTPYKKFARLKYWIPKGRYASPWYLPKILEKEPFKLAKRAVERIMSVDIHSKVEVFKTKDVKDSIDDTWIVSGQSPLQQDILKVLPKDQSIYVEGPERIWLRNESLNYYLLTTDGKPIEDVPPPDSDDLSNIEVPFFNPKLKVVENRTVHEQEDATILAVCITGTSSHDSLLSWVRLLEKNGNSKLGENPVLFRLKSTPREPESEEVFLLQSPPKRIE